MARSRFRAVLFSSLSAVAALAAIPLSADAAAPVGGAAAAAAPVFVVVDAVPTAAGSGVLAAPAAPASGLDVWRRWARLDSGAAMPAAVSAPDVVAGGAVRFPHGESVLLTNTSGAPLSLRVGAKLGAGLWRVEAAQASAPPLPPVAAPMAPTPPPADIPAARDPGDPDPGVPAGDGTASPAAGVAVPAVSSSPAAPAVPAARPAAVRGWRMESVFLPKAGTAFKTVRVGPGETVIVRWTDTVAEAAAACAAARRTEAAGGGPKTYTGVTVSRALARAADLIGQIEVLTARGKRDEIVKRAQNALLLAAQAQAMVRNRDDVALGDDSDAAFTRLTGALSEVSCAACNLVPSETMVTGPAGAVSAVQVSVTNGGTQTIPFVSLALPQAEGDSSGGLGAPGAERTVFRSLAPGAKVTARFPVRAPATDAAAPSSPDDASLAAGPLSRGIVQFILDMGAAVVPSGPVP